MKSQFKFSTHFLSILILLIGSHVTIAQQANEILGIGINALSYRGDLSAYRNLSPGAELSLKLNKNKRFTGKFVVGMGQVEGAVIGDNFDIASPANRFFYSPIYHFHIEANINIIKKEKWSLFVTQGFGVMRFNPQDQFGNPLNVQGNTRRPNEIYGLTAIILPSGIGAHYFINDQIGFACQIGFRNPQTDYLDNVSAYGDPNRNDQILFFNLSFIHAVKIRKHE